jgi:hypothetical protein
MANKSSRQPLRKMRDMLAVTLMSLTGDITSQSERLRKLRRFLAQVQKRHWVQQDHALDYSIDVLQNVLDHISEAQRHHQPLEVAYWYGHLIVELAETLNYIKGELEGGEEDALPASLIQ